MITSMAAEIAEQPAALARTLDALLPRREEVRRLAGECQHVLFVARGTSDNAAVYGRYLVEIHAGRGAGLAAPSLATHYRARRDLTDTLVVSVSQSGETAEIVETQAWARAAGAATLAITNVDDSPLADRADVALPTRAGPEQAVPATKTHTTQLAAIAIVADAFAAAGSDTLEGRPPAHPRSRARRSPSGRTRRPGLRRGPRPGCGWCTARCTAARSIRS